MAQRIIEGTTKDLERYLSTHPDRKFRLTELSETTIAEPPASDTLETGADAALDLLDEWIKEGRAADEQTRLEADREVSEFKRNMNANRAATGDRIVYPSSVTRRNSI